MFKIIPHGKIPCSWNRSDLVVYSAKLCHSCVFVQSRIVGLAIKTLRVMSRRLSAFYKKLTSKIVQFGDIGDVQNSFIPCLKILS